MNKTRIMFSVLLGSFGLLVGMPTTSAFGIEKGTTTNVKSAKVTKVDVNNATKQELQMLPGIGEVHAQKIIDGRPYKSEADLVKTGLPQNTIDKIKSEIRFGKVKKTKTHMKTDSKSASTSKTKTSTPQETAKVPPRKGMVWVNKDTMVYHTEGDRWYGNTKNGEFMNENDAIKFGAHRSKQD